MKYLGSKSKIAHEILNIILDGRKNNQLYIEPFAGGMNVISNVTGSRLANDSNYYLIEMWRKLVCGWIPPKISRETYQDVKNNMQSFDAHFVGWVGFNCSYSGKWFGGYAGETVTKTGVIRDYQDEAIRNVTKQAKLLQGVEFSCADYSDLYIPKNSIVYCDPPYKNTTGYDGAGQIDYHEFWQWVRWNHIGGARVFVSEYDAPEDFVCIWEKRVKSSLSANGKHGGNKESIEKLFACNL
jgi:DNA adenine methylase